MSLKQQLSASVSDELSETQVQQIVASLKSLYPNHEIALLRKPGVRLSADHTLTSRSQREDARPTYGYGATGVALVRTLNALVEEALDQQVMGNSTGSWQGGCSQWSDAPTDDQR